MLKVMWSCHVEPDKKTGGILNVYELTNDFNKINIPVHCHLLSGGTAKNKILNYFYQEKVRGKSRWAKFGVHVHDHLIENTIKGYTKVMKEKPTEISFGHWSYNSDDLAIARKFGIDTDYSWVARKKGERFYVKDPFVNNSMLVVPVVCDPLLPINPFTSVKHFIMYYLLILRFYFSDKTLHFSFHSYDWNPFIGRLLFSVPVNYTL